MIGACGEGFVTRSPAFSLREIRKSLDFWIVPEKDKKKNNVSIIFIYYDIPMNTDAEMS